MKIDEISNNIGLISRSAESASGNKAVNEDPDVTDGSEVVKGGEKIDLSQASVEFNKVLEASDKVKLDRIELVNKLRDKVKNGQYQVDASRVAEKIVREGLLEVLKS